MATYLPSPKTIKVRRTRHAGHCWRSRDELISVVFLWTPSYGRAKAGRQTRTYIQHFCEDTGCRSNERLGGVAGEGQGYMCWRHDMMIMMMISWYVYRMIKVFLTLIKMIILIHPWLGNLFCHWSNFNQLFECPFVLFPSTKSRVKFATLVEGYPKAPFSIATTPRCRGGRHSVPWIAPL